MSTTITIGVVDQVLTLLGTPVVSSGGKNEDFVAFNFDEAWDGFSKIAVFYRQTKDIYYALINDQNVATVPPEVIATSGIMYLGVVGVNADNTVTKTSQVLPYRIVGGALDGFKPEPATPDVFEQMLALAKEMRDLAAEILQRQIDFEENMNQAEQLRVEAENNRVSAENERAEAEENRASAELLRVEAEENRASAEQSRVTSESSRVSAENNRVSAESNRVSAENERAAAEQERDSTWQDLKTEIEQTLQSGVIDDDELSDIKTWSSSKINSELENVQNQIDNDIALIKGVKEVTLGTTWSGNSQTVALDEITANDSPILDIKLNGVEDIALAQEEWAKIAYALTSDGNITFYLSDEANPTTTEITVLVKGV